MIEKLTDRQAQVIDLLCRGFKRKQIAEMLGMSLNCVRLLLGRAGQHLGIDVERFSLSGRIVYLVAQAKGQIGIPSTGSRIQVGTLPSAGESQESGCAGAACGN